MNQIYSRIGKIKIKETKKNELKKRKKNSFNKEKNVFLFCFSNKSTQLKKKIRSVSEFVSIKENVSQELRKLYFFFTLFLI